MSGEAMWYFFQSLQSLLWWNIGILIFVTIVICLCNLHHVWNHILRHCFLKPPFLNVEMSDVFNLYHVFRHFSRRPAWPASPLSLQFTTSTHLGRLGFIHMCLVYFELLFIWRYVEFSNGDVLRLCWVAFHWFGHMLGLCWVAFHSYGHMLS